MSKLINSILPVCCLFPFRILIIYVLCTFQLYIYYTNKTSDYHAELIYYWLAKYVVTNCRQLLLTTGISIKIF